MKYQSSVFSKASGSIGGTVYSRNANGAYTRNRSVPVNRNTEAQKRQRSVFSQVAGFWRNLTAVQKQSFQDQAPNYPYVDTLGETKQYTAKQLHDYLNNNKVLINSAVLTNALPPYADISISNALVETSIAGEDINITELETPSGSLASATDWYVVCYATAIQQGTGKAWKRSDMRVIRTGANNNWTLPLDITADYEAVFGNGWKSAAVGRNCIGFGFVMINSVTGQRNSSMYLTTAIISA